ncbi:MAG: right-handed parallel beta-helix repeat-containing protein [Candidatus Thorarchaeota archaeon]|jgi:parallel beta-helix repeat protein
MAIIIPTGVSSTNLQVIEINQTGPNSKFQISTSYEESGLIQIISDDGFASSSFPGDGTVDNPYRIEGLNITYEARSIDIINTTVHFVIRNCYLRTLVEGVYFNSVENGVIENNIIVAGFEGIAIDRSSNCVIDNNTINDAQEGVAISFSRNNTISNNRIFKNDAGVEIVSSQDVIIAENTIFSNRNGGIQLDSASENNTVFGNSFGWNSPAIGTRENARDFGSNNLWDDNVSIGNSWDDYNGVLDVYWVGSNPTIVDRFPSTLNDTRAPTIDHPDDIEYVDGTSNASITWAPRDEYPYRCRIMMSSRILIEHTLATIDWMGGNITISLHRYDPGEYNFTLIAEDAAGNQGSDSVILVVRIQAIGNLELQYIVLASSISAVLVVSVLLLIKRMR